MCPVPSNECVVREAALCNPVLRIKSIARIICTRANNQRSIDTHVYRLQDFCRTQPLCLSVRLSVDECCCHTRAVRLLYSRYYRIEFPVDNESDKLKAKIAAESLPGHNTSDRGHEESTEWRAERNRKTINGI